MVFFFFPLSLIALRSFRSLCAERVGMNGVIIVTLASASAESASAAAGPALSLQRHATACLQIKVLFLNAPAHVAAEHHFGTESRQTVRSYMIDAFSLAHAALGGSNLFMTAFICTLPHYPVPPPPNPFISTFPSSCNPDRRRSAARARAPADDRRDCRRCQHTHCALLWRRRT
jgi:hypothetical protein